MTEHRTRVDLLHYAPTERTFLDDVVAGLSEQPKRLPCKYFYNDRGSQLFERICQLDEYYLTRTELAIMQKYAPQMAAQIGPGVMLVEYGSGSSIKTRILLDHLADPVAYVPVDISREHLQRTADQMSAAYPRLEVLPVSADFTEEFELPISRRDPTHSAVYFPGSTIGNFGPEQATKLLGPIAPLCGRGGGLLIGIDLQKDTGTIEAAYNDREGVTAQFNLNLLRRINDELGADFNIEQFYHKAIFNQSLGRVEMYLISRQDQRVAIGGEQFGFVRGERICTEHSHKYTIDGFAAIAADANLTLHRYWTDEQDRFAVAHLAVV